MGMENMKFGLLPSQAIRELVEDRCIASFNTGIEPEQVQPASLDLRLGLKAYKIPASFLAGKHRMVAMALLQMGAKDADTIDLFDGAVLDKGCVYLIPILEYFNLPKTVSAITNAKSSTGRVDLFVRIITDFGEEYDKIPAGYSGALYAEICPSSFDVVVRAGMKLNQARFFRNQKIMNITELNAIHAKHPLVDNNGRLEKGVRFSVDLKDELVGYRASPQPNAPAIDLDEIAKYKVHNYWQPVFARHGSIVLEPNKFYILSSKEAVCVPPDYAAEMSPYMPTMGEFRVHYAGFFDPGFGFNKPSKGVLEIRCHQVPVLLEHGQVVGELIYEGMAETPDILYGGKELSSNYQGQGVRLSKHFVSPSE